MSPFLDDDELEIARRLRRAAGPTPDVYVAYDTVLDEVGAARRRRRLAVSGTSVVAIAAMGGMYVLNLQGEGRTVRSTAPASSVAPSTTAVLDVDVRPTVLVVTTVPATTTTTAAVPDPTVPATTAALESAALEGTVLESAVTETTPSPTLPPAPAPAPPATTAKRRPPSTSPPVVQPPATEAPVETVPPDTAPPSTDVPPTAAPETTVAPTVPDTTAPPAPAPPLATTPGQPVPESPGAVASASFTDAHGNSVTASYLAGRLQFGPVQAANGWESLGASYPSDTRAVITFAAAAAADDATDPSKQSVITAVVDGGAIRFS